MLLKPITRVWGHRSKYSVVQKGQVTCDKRQEDRPDRNNDVTDKSERVCDVECELKHGCSFQKWMNSSHYSPRKIYGMKKSIILVFRVIDFRVSSTYGTSASKMPLRQERVSARS